jgi:PhnB protein
MSKLLPVPRGYHTVIPYLTVHNAAEAIQFYKDAFAAIELNRITQADMRIGYAEIKIGDSRIMLSDEFPEISVLSPQTLGGTPVALHLYVEDVDAVAEQAVAAGMRVIRQIADQPVGIRNGIFECPYGHRWFISSRIAAED